MGHDEEVKEKYSQFIAKLVYPNIKFTAYASEEDRRGIDAYLSGHTVQLKWDGTIGLSNRLWDEIRAKEKGHPEHQWHKAKRTAEFYLFVTQNATYTYTFLCKLNDLARVERYKKAYAISTHAPTSEGYYIGILDIPMTITILDIKPFFSSYKGESITGRLLQQFALDRDIVSRIKQFSHQFISPVDREQMQMFVDDLLIDGLCGALFRWRHVLYPRSQKC
jgi:hypothetical protein